MDITSIDDIKAHDGEEVTVTGTYVESIIAMRPTPDMDNDGRYQIRVNDSLEVVLLPPYMDESQRPAEGIERFNGERVKVTGIILSKTYMRAPSLEYQSQSVSTPCFIEIKSIELAD